MNKKYSSTKLLSVSWYCPNGHNVFESSKYCHDTAPECGCCGALMTMDPSQFDDTHEILEASLITLYETTVTTNKISADER